MIKVIQVGSEEFLTFGRDRMVSIPIKSIRKVEYRDEYVGSWISIEANENFYFEEPDGNAKELIAWFEGGEEEK